LAKTSINSSLVRLNVLMSPDFCYRIDLVQQAGSEIRPLTGRNLFVPPCENGPAVDRPQTSGAVQVRRQQVDHSLAPDVEIRALDRERQDRDPRRGLGDRLGRGEAATAIPDDDVEARQAEQEREREHASRYGAAPREVRQLAAPERAREPAEVERTRAGQLAAGGPDPGLGRRLDPGRGGRHGKSEDEQDDGPGERPAGKSQAIDRLIGREEEEGRDAHVREERPDEVRAAKTDPMAAGRLLLDGLEQRDLRLLRNPDERMDPPLPRDALQLVAAALLEPEARARLGVHDRARHQHFARPGERGHAGSDVNGQAADVPLLELDLAHVEAAPYLEAELADRVPDRVGARQRARGALEDDEESVARRLDLAPRESLEPAPDDSVMAVEECVPCLVAHARGALGRADDVGEQDRGERALGGHRTPGKGAV